MTPQYFAIKKASQRGFALGEAFFYCSFGFLINAFIFARENFKQNNAHYG